MKRGFLAITAAMLGMFMFSAYGMRIAVVNFSEILQQDPMVKTMQKQLQGKFDPQGAKLIKERDLLRAKVVKFRNTPLADIKMRKLLADQVLTEQQKLREKQVDFQRALFAAQNKGLQDVLQYVRSVVQRIAVREKYDFVLANNNVIYSPSQDDITNKVIQELKKQAALERNF